MRVKRLVTNVMLMIILIFYAMVASATTMDAGKQVKPAFKTDNWHYAGLRWYAVGDNLVFIFPANRFYRVSESGVSVKKDKILSELAMWLKPIPKTWVRFTGFRRGGNNVITQRQAIEDARALATYFWDADIDARGVYTNGFIEAGDKFTQQATPDRVEMVVSILPLESMLL